MLTVFEKLSTELKCYLNSELVLNSVLPFPCCMCVSGKALNLPELQLLIFKMELISHKIFVMYNDCNVKHQHIVRTQ